MQNSEVLHESGMIHVSQIAGVARNEDYSFRAPYPPHLNIPQSPETYVLQPPSCDQFQCEDEGYRKDLRAIIAQSVNFEPATDWKYEWRRGAQRILPFLYLGPFSAGRDTEFLKREKVTMLLAIRDSAIAQANLLDGAKVAHQLGIESASVDVAGYTGLIAAFPCATKIINDHIVNVYRQFNRCNTGIVLVACESGNERSAAVVSAYLMSTYGIDLACSIHCIQAHRFCISLDDNLKNLLHNYMDILDAKKKVINNDAHTTVYKNSSKNHLKRRRDEVEEERDNITIDDFHDSERFTGRAGYAPFR